MSYIFVEVFILHYEVFVKALQPKIICEMLEMLLNHMLVLADLRPYYFLLYFLVSKYTLSFSQSKYFTRRMFFVESKLARFEDRIPLLKKLGGHLKVLSEYNIISILNLLECFLLQGTYMIFVIYV